MAAPSAASTEAMNAMLTEHFSYTPLTLVDDIINIVNEVVYRAVSAIEAGLTGAGPEVLGFKAKSGTEPLRQDTDDDGNTFYPDVQTEIEEGVHALETLLEANVDKTFDRLELYVLRNILYVEERFRPWVRLSHYDNLDFSENSSNSSPEDLIALRRKLQQSRKLNKALSAQARQNQALIDDLKAILHPSAQPSDKPSLTFLSSNTSAQALDVNFAKAAATSEHHPITNETQTAIAQLPALRELLRVLRPKLAALNAAPMSDKQTERGDYLETGVRKQLQQAGADPETGEGLIGKPHPGWRVGKEEIASIELVADMLAGEHNAGDPMET